MARNNNAAEPVRDSWPVKADAVRVAQAILDGAR